MGRAVEERVRLLESTVYSLRGTVPIRRGLPTVSEGQDGGVLVAVDGSFVYLCVKVNGRWHYTNLIRLGR